MDGLDHDLAVLDQVGVDSVSHPDMVILVGPLQESHAALGGNEGVVESPALWQLLRQSVGKVAHAVMTPEDAAGHDDHDVLSIVPLQVRFKGLLELPGFSPSLGQPE